MTDVTVPTAQPLVHIPGVELMKTGTWVLASGTTTFTRDDLAAAVAALDCPAVRRPQIKLGHTDPRFDGEPCVGFIDNMAVTDDGATLVGDYAGLPNWLGDVIASAYPDRSVEGAWDVKCGLGHVHPFIVSAVALLGVTAPGISALASLTDIGVLYGVAAASAPIPGSFTIPNFVTAKEATVPNPQPLKVTASVNVEDIRRAFYKDADWSQWIEEVQLAPEVQVIVVDDDDGERSRVPVVIDAAKDGEDAVSFGAAVAVTIRYEDTPNEDAGEVAAKAAAQRVVFASRAESRPGKKPAASADPQEPPAEPAETNTPNQKGTDTMSDTTLTTGLRERLGIKADVELDEAGVLAALDEALAEQVKEPVAASTETKIPEGKILISSDVFDELKISAKAGAEARSQQLAEARDTVIASAVKDGKIAPARKQFWATKWDKDPEGAKADLDSIEKGLIPVTATGYSGGSEGDGDDVVYSSLFADEKVGA